MLQGTFPKIDVDSLNLSEDQKAIVSQIVAKRKGVIQLRASKPKDGIAAYVWRMVAFYVSPKQQHHCMPVCADFGIENEVFAHYSGDYNHQKLSNYVKAELDPIVDVVVNSIPVNQQYGVRRWRKAFYG